MQAKQWFSCAELAELRLAGLPRTAREIARLAERDNWGAATDARGVPLARRRQGRGGGTEYHVELLPAATRAGLARAGVLAADADLDAAMGAEAGATPDAANLWHWLAQQDDAVRAEAARRLGIIGKIELLEAAGVTRSAAVLDVAAAEGVASSTLWNWLRQIDGVAVADRLPYLAPRRAGGGKECEVDPEIWQALLSDYLRPAKPTWMTAYRRSAEPLAKVKGVALPHPRTLLRKFEREVPRQVVVLRRDGEEALRRMLPAQIRSVAELSAMELVNIDGHRCDVFVRMPGGEIIRPTMVAIQDVYSRKYLAWRIAVSEDMVTARLAFADLFAKWGIPKGLLADNGRAFASKWLTGGARTRFRFKIRDEDPTGLLTALGITIHWAKPYRGQSKPIERGFRDFCEAIAKHPAFDGAYTGNSPMAKPEDYRSRAIDHDVFMAVWNAGVEAHNRQPGRRSEMARGRASFDQVFEESYARVPVGKASEEQLRMALLAADQLFADRKTGAITLAGNRYWTEAMIDLAGSRVTVRFDPENLHSPVHVYDRDGRFLLTAPLWEATGFLDMAAAKQRQKMERDWKKKAKAATEALDLLSAADLAARLPDYDGEPHAPEISVPRLVRHRGQIAAQLKPDYQAVEAAFNAPSTVPAGEASIDRFARATRHLRPVD